MLTYDICSLINTKWYKLHYYERLYGPQEYMFSSRAQGLRAELYIPVADGTVGFNKYLNLLRYAAKNGCIKIIEYIYFNETDLANKICMCYHIWGGNLSSVKWAYNNNIIWYNHQLVTRIHLIYNNLDILKFIHNHLPQIGFDIIYCNNIGYKETLKWFISIDNNTLAELKANVDRINTDEMTEWYNSEFLPI